MRILFLSNLYPPDVSGGAEILAGDIANGLERLGHEIFVLTSTRGSQSPKAQQEARIWRTLQSSPAAYYDLRRPPWQQLNLLSNYHRRYHNPANAAELLRVIKETRPDVLYIWEVTGIGVNSLLKVLPEITIPIVFHLGSYWLLYARSPQTEQSRLKTRWLKSWLIGTIDMPAYTSLIAVSETVKHKYVQDGYDPERIEVIYNGIDQRFLRGVPLEEREDREIMRINNQEPLQFIFVGRLRVEKGLMVLLKALDLISHGQEGTTRRPMFHLDVYGNGEQIYIDEMQEFLREKHLTNVVTFHGTVPQDELIKRYDQADIMFVPSLWQEPFGLVLAEAMARALPVIASRVGGPAEIVSDGENGLLVEPGDERLLAMAIMQLLENPTRRLQLGQTAHETARQRFTIEENARRVEQHLLRAIEQRKQNPVDMHV